MTEATAPELGALVLEEKSRLSHSIIWNWMRNFYDQQGVAAWLTGTVPNFVTTNSCIARMYARVLLGFLRDCFSPSGSQALQCDPKEPVYFIELGAGHGKFGFLILQRLMQLREFLPQTERKWCFKYILTDFTENNIEFWRQHRCFKKFIDEGLVDFAKYDAENDHQIHLILSGQVLQRGSVANPMVVVANYLLDTLRHEAFRIQNGQLQEALLTVLSDRPHEPDSQDPGLIKRARFVWDYQNTGLPYFTGRHDDLNAVLERMLQRESLRNSSILLPVGGLACIRQLLAITNNRLAFLSGDKAYNHEEELVGLRHPHIAVHGSFSMMVNYDAVSHYFESQGGFSLRTPQLDGFKVALFLNGADRDVFGETCLSFRDSIETFGPDSFSVLQRSIHDEAPNPSLKHIVSLLRLSGHDSDVFYKFKQPLIDQISYSASSEKFLKDVKRDLECMYDSYYPLSKSKDVAFELGRLYMGMNDYATSIRYFVESLRDCGEHHVTYYNLGLCHHYCGQLVEALDCFNHSVRLRADYREAREWQSRLQIKLQTINSYST